MPRHLFVILTIFVLIIVHAGAGQARGEQSNAEDQVMAQQREAAKNRKRRIIYNNDGNEILIRRVESVEDFLRMRIEAAVGTQVDSIFYCTGTTTLYGHDTLIADRFDSPVDKVKDWADNMRLLRKAGTDQLEATIRRGHEAGLEVFWSHRINDSHDAVDPVELLSQWKADHPECLMGKPEDAKKYPQSSPRYWWTTLDFEKQEVRDYLLRITEEVCRLYDVDGIEIDYFRYPMFFRPNLDFEPATQKQLDILTEFQRSIMQMSVREGAKRGRPILVAARVPASVTACRNVGIDVERWLREGLLDIMPLGNGGAWPNVPVEEITTLAHTYDVPVYPCLKHSGFGHSDIETWRAAAANARQAGADGIYFFNHFPSEPSPQFKELGDPVNLARLDKRFTATDVSPYEEILLGSAPRHIGLAEVLPPSMGLPARIFAGDEPYIVTLQIGDDLAEAARQGILAGAVLKIRLSPPQEVLAMKVKLNGKPVTPAEENVEEGWLTLHAEPGWYREGENEVSFLRGASNVDARAPFLVHEVQVDVTYRDK